jgi:uncharacterized membrane protein YeaQ/YmgE (transglycosylase-associated protein family)
MIAGILAFFVVSAFCAMLAGLMMMPVPQESSQLINTFMGVLGGMTVTVVNYYFGSSKQSQGKDDTINKMVGTGDGSRTNGVPPKPGDAGTVEVKGTVAGTMKEIHPPNP